MNPGDFRTRVRRFIRSLQRLDDAGKRRVIAGVSVVSMVLVVGFWVRSLENLVPTLTEETATTSAGEESPSFLGTLSRGIRSIAGDFSDRLQSVKDKTVPIFNSIGDRLNGGNAYVITPRESASGSSSTSSPMTISVPGFATGTAPY